MAAGGIAGHTPIILEGHASVSEVYRCSVLSVFPIPTCAYLGEQYGQNYYRYERHSVLLLLTKGVLVTLISWNSLYTTYIIPSYYWL
jgi:hypothetical protein